MTRAVWENLLDAARETHRAALPWFCTFPDDLRETTLTPHRIGAADLFEADIDLTNAHPLARQFCAASPYAQWRETYKGSAIGDDFLNRFGCFCLIGSGGAYLSDQMGAYVVYMPPDLPYPWHHHPAEEAYLILAGSAEFHREGHAPETLSAGEISHHTPGQPHATMTADSSLIAYVVWKGDQATKPIWTKEALR